MNQGDGKTEKAALAERKLRVTETQETEELKLKQVEGVARGGAGNGWS